MDVGGTDIHFKWLAAPVSLAFKTFVAEFMSFWPHAVFDVFYSEDEYVHYNKAEDIDFSRSTEIKEILIYKDAIACDMIEQKGCDDDTANLFVHALSYKPNSFTVVIHHFPDPEILARVERLQKSLCD